MDGGQELCKHPEPVGPRKAGRGGFCCYKPVKEKDEGPRCGQLEAMGEPTDAVLGERRPKEEVCP